MTRFAHGRSLPTPLFWWLAVLAGPPVAWLAARAGWGLAVGDPARDLALLMLVTVAEEIVFRGAVQPGLARLLARRDAALPGLTLSNVATSALFALAHLWRHAPLAAAAVFAVSLVYGIARERSGRVWPAALLHAWFNVALYAASWIARGSAA